MKHLYFFLLSFPVTTLFAQTTLILQPDASAGKDARIFNIGALANYGNDVDFIASILDYAGEPGTTRSIIQFDLSSIPLNAHITDASLSLYYNNTSKTPGQMGNNAAYLRRLIEPWDENTVAWNGQPNYVTDNEVLIPASTFESQDYENIDVTELVQDMVQFPATSHGFMFMLQTEQGLASMKFYSSDGSDPNKHPRLVVTYSGTVANEDIHSNGLSIYPSPFEDAFTIEGIEENASLHIIDLQGRTIHEGVGKGIGNTIHVDALRDVQDGMYLLLATSKTGTYSARIVKAN